MYVLIPSYEPTQQLVELVSQLRILAPEVGVLVVDDGSGPAYAPLCEAVSEAGGLVLHHERNFGKGSALKTGLAYLARHHPDQGVVTADADGQHRVEDILAVAADVRESNERTGRVLVLGCRDFSGNVPLRSRIGNSASRFLFRVASGWRLSDTQTGLRGFSAAQIPWLLSVPGDRFEYEQRVLLGLRGAGVEARERSIQTVYLEENRSSHFRPVLDSLRVMLPILLFATSSLLGFVIDTAALFLLYAVSGQLVLSIVLARLLSAAVNFWVNRRVVFMRRGREGLARQAIGYALLAAVLLASNIVWMSYLTGVGVPLWLAKLVTEVVLFFTSYGVQRNAVFGGAAGRGASATQAPQKTLVV